jgi:hypothetical protein
MYQLPEGARSMSNYRKYNRSRPASSSVYAIGESRYWIARLDLGLHRQPGPIIVTWLRSYGGYGATCNYPLTRAASGVIARGTVTDATSMIWGRQKGAIKSSAFRNIISLHKPSVLANMIKMAILEA